MSNINSTNKSSAEKMQVENKPELEKKSLITNLQTSNNNTGRNFVKTAREPLGKNTDILHDKLLSKASGLSTAFNQETVKQNSSSTDNFLALLKNTKSSSSFIQNAGTLRDPSNTIKLSLGNTPTILHNDQKENTPDNQNSKSNNQDNETVLSCMICYETFTGDANNSYKAAKCGHIACTNCWNTALEIKLECPMCKCRVRMTNLIDLKN